MSLEKLVITNIDAGSDIKAFFNPTQLTYNKGAKLQTTQQKNSTDPKTDVDGGTAGKLSFQLLLDGTMAKKVGGVFDTEVGDNDLVTKTVEKLGELLVVKEYTDDGAKVSRTPFCKVIWGKHQLCKKGLLSSLNVTYTLFLPNGVPVRAKVDLSFQQVGEGVPGQNPTSRSEARKTWLVVEGETLDWIAYKEYGDPSQWRYIAETNNLSNPRALRPGQLLKIVPLP